MLKLVADTQQAYSALVQQRFNFLSSSLTTAVSSSGHLHHIPYTLSNNFLPKLSVEIRLFLKKSHLISNVNRCIIILNASGYGLAGPVTEFRWGKIFRYRPDGPWGPAIPLYNGYQVSYGVKRAGHGIYHPSLFSTEVKEIVTLFLHFP
jgi:hypothetical protein